LYAVFTDLSGGSKDVLDVMPGGLLLGFVSVLRAELDHLLPRHTLPGKQLLAFQTL